MKTKTQGFPGQIIHFLPANLTGHIGRHPLGVGLHVKCIGWYPKALGHGIQRPDGLDEFIVIVCTQGKGWAEIDRRRLAVAAGQVLYIPSNKPHAYGSDDDDPWSIHWVHCAGTSAASYASLLQAREYVLSIPSADAREIARMFRQMYRLASTGLTERTALLVSHILRHVLGLLFFQTGQRPVSGSSAIAHDMIKSVEYMRANVTRSLTLRELSRQAGLSPTRFSALFREQTGSSPVDHHIRLRMQAACHCLDTTALSVKEVAVRFGYDDPYYFSSIFQKILGCSPLAYRRSVKG